MRRLVTWFLQGCLVVVPGLLTAYVLYFVVQRIDRLLPSPVPGAGLLAALAMITGVGALTSNVLGRAIGRQLERLIERVPLVRLLYATARDLLRAFIGEERSFDRPVVVSLSADEAIKALGFVTREDLADLGLRGHVLVYLPQAYNLAGNVLAFPSERVRRLDVEAGRVMALVVSGGVVHGTPRDR